MTICAYLCSAYVAVMLCRRASTQFDDVDLRNLAATSGSRRLLASPASLVLSLLTAAYFSYRSSCASHDTRSLHRLSDPFAHRSVKFRGLVPLPSFLRTCSSDLAVMLTILSDITGIGAEERTPYDPAQELPPGSLEGKVFLVTGGHGGIVRPCQASLMAV